MKEVLLILLGWGLGAFSPWVAERVQRPARRAQIKKGLVVELLDLSTKLAAMVISVKSYNGTLDAETLGWFKQLSDKNPEAFELAVSDPRFKEFSQLDDETIRTMSRAKASRTTISKLYFKRHSLSYLEAHLSDLSLFPEDFQRIAHRIRGRLAILNQEIDLNSFYFQRPLIPPWLITTGR